MEDSPNPIFVDTKQAANLLGLSASTLEKWRHFRVPDQPAYVKIGNAVRYPHESLREWAASRPRTGGLL